MCDRSQGRIVRWVTPALFCIASLCGWSIAAAEADQQAEVDRQTVQSRIDALADANDLSADEKEQRITQYRTVLSRIDSTVEFEASAAQFESARETAPAEEQRLRAEAAATPDDAPLVTIDPS